MCRKSNKDPRSTFFEGLKSFLIVNAIVVFITMRGGQILSWWWLPAFIWGISLLNQYRKAFYSDDPFLPEGKRGFMPDDRRRTPVEKPKWKEKDLV